jgi:hypothetical protein
LARASVSDSFISLQARNNFMAAIVLPQFLNIGLGVSLSAFL